ncbi:hypothetical protein Tco_0006061 [Tanacetum coccineum]
MENRCTCFEVVASDCDGGHTTSRFGVAVEEMDGGWWGLGLGGGGGTQYSKLFVCHAGKSLIFRLFSSTLERSCADLGIAFPQGDMGICLS